MGTLSRNFLSFLLLRFFISFQNKFIFVVVFIIIIIKLLLLLLLLLLNSSMSLFSEKHINISVWAEPDCGFSLLLLF